MYVATYGARAPLLALLGLRRLPNLVVILAPYAVTVPLSLSLADRLDPPTAAGLTALALAPGVLFAPALVTAARGRGDMAGALLLGTVFLSLVLVATRADTMAPGLAAAQAFAVGALLAGAVPRVRDRALVPLRWTARAAALVVILFAALSRPAIDAGTIAVAVISVSATLAIAGAVALALRRDVLSAVAATGMRDPVVAAALAWGSGGPDATGVPLASAVILGIAATAVMIRRR